MPVAVAQPQKKKRDIIDLLLVGLKGASAFTNIQKGQAELEAIPGKAEIARLEKTNKQLREEKKDIREADKDDRSIADKRFDQLGKIKDKLKGDKEFQKASAKVLSGQELLRLGEQAMKGSQQAFSAMQSIIAGNVLSGVLTDQDLTRFNGAQGWLDKIEREAVKAGGAVNIADIEDLLDLANNSAASGMKVIDVLREDAISSGLKRFEVAGITDVSREQLESVIDINNLIEAAAIAFPKRTTKINRSILPSSGSGVGTNSPLLPDPNKAPPAAPGAGGFNIDDFLGGP
tara:strand:+ start:1272 stop:2138 length:867 start_codon:yes stop_codon:yes gene_type:complete